MKLETILQLLYINDLQDIVARAVQIDNNIPLPLKEKDLIKVRIHKDDLPTGKKFKGDSWGTMELIVEAVNPYSLKEPYLVILPNGKQKWVGTDDNRYTTAAEIVDIVESAAVIADR